MAVKLHRCKNLWAKTPGTRAGTCRRRSTRRASSTRSCTSPWPSRKKRTAVIENTGQALYPAIEFEDGTWYREQSKEMVKTIREGRLHGEAGRNDQLTTRYT